jgi:type II secretory pathway pseudopilin PulG
MPSSIPSHIYTMFALAIIGSLLVATVNSYTASLRNISEIQQLRNMLGLVAAKGSDLATLAAFTQSTAHASIPLPVSIGIQQYWVRARNDSSSAWIEGALGRISPESPAERVYLPKSISASGNFTSGYGSAALEAYMNGSIPQLNLSSLRG